MPVAKKYQRCDIMGDVFTQNHRKYVTIQTPFGEMKNVRWYSDAEYRRMYPEDTVEKKDYLKYSLGFGDEEFITIYFGNTYDNLNWFKTKPSCRFNKMFNWFTPGAESIPNDIPENIQTARIEWNQVSPDGYSVDESITKNLLENIIYPETASEFIGEVGDRLSLILTVKKVVSLDGAYGPSSMHMFIDENNNEFVWVTSSRTLNEGSTYSMKATVKDHKIYHNSKQTWINRPSGIKEEYDD